MDLDEEDIDAYDVSNAIVLSDLGESGKLYGFSEYPEPIRTIEFDRE